MCPWKVSICLFYLAITLRIISSLLSVTVNRYVHFFRQFFSWTWLGSDCLLLHYSAELPLSTALLAGDEVTSRSTRTIILSSHWPSRPNSAPIGPFKFSRDSSHQDQGEEVSGERAWSSFWRDIIWMKSFVWTKGFVNNTVLNKTDKYPEQVAAWHNFSLIIITELNSEKLKV